MTELYEIVFRGAAAGVSFLLAAALFVAGAKLDTKRLGALFSFAIGVYVLISGEPTHSMFGFLTEPGIIISILATPLFWWFAASLFDDEYRWTWWRIAPAFLLPGFYLVRKFVVGDQEGHWLIFLHLSMNAALFADCIRLAIMNMRDDLVNPRRLFRVVAALVIAMAGISIAGVELFAASSDSLGNNAGFLPRQIHLAHASALFVLNFLFGFWMLTPRVGLFAEAAVAAAPDIEATPIAAADRPAFEKLTSLMEAGAYCREDLTVAVLAAEVGIAEHQLRKLINGSLGFRNFSAFLNEHRITEAQKMLANPANVRKQVLTIALDLGYGSVAPFNRAFKMKTGQTPTEYRKNALEKS